MQGVSFCSSIDGMYRYVINGDLVNQYDLVGNLIAENVPITDEIRTRAKPCHCLLMVDLITKDKVRLIKSNGDIKEYEFSVALFKAYEMLNMLIGKDIRFKTHVQKDIQGVSMTAFLLCITDTVDIESVLAKLPQ